MRGIPVALLLTVSCATHSRRVTDLPEAWRSFPETPFVGWFDAGAKEVAFVATSHAADVRSPTFRMVRATFERFEPDVVVVEGLPTAEGVDPAAWVARAASTPADERFWKGGEPSYAAALAVASGVPFVGGEPTHTQCLEAARASGYSLLDYWHFDVVRQIPQWFRRGDLTTDATPALIEAQFEAFATSEAQRLSVDREQLDAWADFVAWYEAEIARPLDVLAVTSALIWPREEHEAPMTNRIGAVVHRFRNAHLVEVVRQQLETHDRVLVVYGAGHFDVAPELEALLGTEARLSR